MPSAAIHICIGKKIAKKKKIDELPFIFGNVAPDSWRNNNESTRYRSHFSNSEIKEDYNSFYEKYKNYMNNPFVLGYLTHLIIDFYYRKNVDNKIVTATNGEKQIAMLDGSFLSLKNHNAIFKQNKVYLSNQLTNYFKLKKLDINQIKNLNIQVEEVNVSSIIKTVNYINEIELVNKIIPNNIFNFDEVLKIIDDCTIFVLKELKKLNL